MGAGDGVHTIGPGTVVLHFDDVARASRRRDAKLMTYEMTDQFTVNAKVFGIGTSRHERHEHEDDAERLRRLGARRDSSDRTLRWSTLWNGIHTDGHVTCSGSMCGRFGAPPQRAERRPHAGAPGGRSSRSSTRPT